MDTDTIVKGELFILNGLQWEMCSITPFCFVDYYYPNFEVFGGFKRQSINEIIIQSQEGKLDRITKNMCIYNKIFLYDKGN